MQNKKTFWQKNISEISEELVQFFQNSWPISWSNFSRPSLLLKAVFESPYLLKVLLVACLGLLIVSVSVFGNGLYMAFTISVPTDGGEIREVVIGDKVERFNPLLAPTSETEKKIVNLLYHPLYHVEFPDFLNNSVSKTPKIIPVLIESEPKWETSDDSTDSSNFKSLRMKLRGDIFWSDGSPITVSDLRYSFERLKEDKGNPDFRDIFKDYELVPIDNSTQEFAIQPKEPSFKGNSQLIYFANFSPVSEKFYSGLDTAGLFTSFKSLQPVVTSGFFTFPTKTIDPDGNGKQEVENPIRKGFDNYSVIVLNKNPKQNLKNENVRLEKYILKIVDQIEDKGGSDKSSVAREAGNKKLDIFTRYLDPSNTLSSSELSKLTGLRQKLLKTNTYFQVFLNIQATGGGLDGYFINQGLRKYVVCSLINSDFTPTGDLKNYELIPPEKRLLPIQFSEDFSPDCANAEAELINLTNSRGTKIYSVQNDERTGIKNVLVFGQAPALTMLGIEEFRSFTEIVQNQLQIIGLPTTVQFVPLSELNEALKTTNYHFAALPVTILTENPYSLYGLNAKNVSRITQNERVNGKAIETALQNYSESGLQDQESKSVLLDFYKNQYVSVNLFQSLIEINYSTRISNLESTLPNQLSFSTEIYKQIPRYFTETKRQFSNN